MTPRERAGYWVWGAVALVVAVPELWALAAGDAPWPTISGTTAHLEELWHPTAVIVVALIVVAAALAAGYGRMPQRPEPPGRAGWWPYAYLGGAAALTAVVGLVASQLVNGPEGRFVLGYVIYGLIGFFFLFLPAVFGWAFAVPFPPLTRTLADLEKRVPLVALVVLAGLVILLIHLALYPWPDVSHHNPEPGSA